MTQRHPRTKQSNCARSPAKSSRNAFASAQLPFSVWDQHVRLSIAGYQDKIAVYEHDGRLFW